MGLRSLGHPRFRVDRLGRVRHANIEGNRSHPKIFAKIRKSAGDLNAPSEASTNATFSVKIQHPREGPLHKSFIAKRLNAWRPFGPPMQPLKPPKFAPARAPKRFHKWPPRSKVAKGRRKLTLMSLLGRKQPFLDAKINFSRQQPPKSVDPGARSALCFSAWPQHQKCGGGKRRTSFRRGYTLYQAPRPYAVPER
jgi:hypothetical protein